jgi:pimeloyl-ACP methyl ester carboxylesterase
MSRFSRAALGWGLVAAAVSAALIQYKVRRAEAANPPRGAFIDVDGVRLHYLDRGLGTPLVMLHGNGTMAQDFEISGLVELASRKYRVIAFDRPGFGYSERPRDRIWGPQAQADLLHRALKQLGVEQCVLLGHSWGAMVAVAYALKYPADLRSVVLLSGYYYPSLRLDVPLFSVPAVPVIGDFMRYTISPWLGRAMWPRLLHKMFGPGPLSPKAFQLPAWMALRPSQLRASAAESALMIPASIGLMRQYSKITIPVHIMAGSADQYVSTGSQSARLHRRVHGSTFRETAGAGHMIHYIAPEEVLEVIDKASGPHPMRSAVMEDAREVVSQLPTGGDIFKRLAE